MARYKNILLAVDLHPAYDELATQRDMEISKDNNAQLYVLHALEEIHAYGATQGFDLILELETKLSNEAKKLLNELTDKIEIPSLQQILVQGSPKMLF